MFRSFLISAFRNIFKYKTFSFINIAGLSIGIAVSIFGFLYVYHELSYDKFNKNSEKIYRIAVDALIGSTDIYQTFTPAPMAQALYNEFPEIDKVCRITNPTEIEYTVGEKNYLIENTFYTDSTFFEIFTFPVVYGKTSKLLNEPYTAVLTKSTAVKLFGDRNPVDEIIEKDSTVFKIIAVVEDVPANSHFNFDLALSLTSFDGMYNDNNWFNNNFRTYIMTHENADADNIQERLPDFTDKYLFNGRYSENTAKGNKWVLYLQSLECIHLDSHIRGEFKPNGNREYVQIFMIVSIFILLIACVNFINLSTARSATRAKEVGIRKVVGSNRRILFWQFFGESMLITFFSLLIALSIVEIVIGLSDFTGLDFSMSYLSNPYTIPLLLLLVLIVGTISGIYPAMVLSSYRPLVVLKEKGITSKGAGWFRSVLVVIQFTISVGLIVGTVVISKQLNLLQNVNLGFDKEHVVTIENVDLLKGNTRSFIHDIKQLSFAEEASNAHRLPGMRLINIGFGVNNFETNFSLNLILCDENLLDVLKFELLAGRFFSGDFPTDTAAIVINESAVKTLGWTVEEALGQKLNDWSPERNMFHVIGVVKDFYYESKHNKIQPMGFLLYERWFGNGTELAAIRMKPGDTKFQLTEIEKIWNNYGSEIPFKYSFLDNEYDAMYRNEMTTQKLFITFSFLAIFIACLGLLGLASFIIMQKTKEIGIRKALGSSLFGIYWFISQKFGKWVIIANVIAIPLSWFLMKRWLENFEYRISISWWIFLLATVISILIALLTTFYQTIRASRANPVDALRYE
ncbi:MAG: ABC transporter permease [Bacteroidetes bacterium]|nr:ABC transporter permease [Bacteroidota bacterium]